MSLGARSSSVGQGEDSGAASATGARTRLAEWRDAVVASDPGLNRLVSALELMASIAVTIGVIYVFMQLTHVLWVPAPAGHTRRVAEQAVLVAQHHGITLLAMLLGGIIAMLCAMAVHESGPRARALTMALMPIPMLMTMALAIELVPDHAVGIAVLAVVMGVGTYLRKFVALIGSRAVLFGILLFIGYIVGFLGNGEVTEGDLGGIAEILWLAVVVNFVLKVCIVRLVDRGRFTRTSRALLARCRGIMSTAIALFDVSDERDRRRAQRRLHRRLALLNQTALIIDASIADVEDWPPGTAAVDAHDRLFELELIVQNIARIAERLSAAELPVSLRVEIRGWLADLRAGRSDRAVAAIQALEGDASAWLAGVPDHDVAGVQRLASTIIDAAAARQAWRRRGGGSDADEPFESAVTLMGNGDLPGAALVGARAAGPSGARTGAWMNRFGLDASAQVAIRITVAVGAAAALGSILSERRFYWAVIAVFIAFMGTHTAGEQVIKALNRILGTVVGILIGSLLAHAIGLSSWSIAVIIVSLGVGMYFMKVSYGLMVIGVTIMVSQLYVELGEYSNQLLVLRLEETAIGAAMGALAALVIFPVKTRRAATIAAVGYLEALSDLLDQVGRQMRDHDSAPRLTTASRALDYAVHQFVAAAGPLQYTTFRRGGLEHNVSLVSQTADQARNLIAAVGQLPAPDAHVIDQVIAALRAQQSAVTKLARGLETGHPLEPPHRLDDEQIVNLEDPASSARSAVGDPQFQLARRIDRLDETIAELYANLSCHQRSRRVFLRGSRARKPTWST